MSQMLGIRPIKLTLLSGGTFLRFYNEKQKSGVDLAHLKPPHMNPSDTVVEDVIRLSGSGGSTKPTA